MDMTQIIEQMIVLFLIMGTGYLCGRKGYMDESFSKKLSALVVLQGAVNAKRAYTCAAIERAVAGGFLDWNSETGTLAARRLKPQKKASLLDDETKRAGNAAEKIGEWFAGESLSDICVLLGVSPL